MRDDSSTAPGWAVLVLAVLTLALEAILWWLLPDLGVHWIYDYWRVGGFLGLVAPLLLGAWLVDRRCSSR